MTKFTSMPETKNTNNRDANNSTNTGHYNGLSPPLDIYNISKESTIGAKAQARPRRLNEYTTIPRQRRHHNGRNDVQTDLKCSKDTVEPVKDSLTVSSSTEKQRDRTWSFKKLKQALVRTKSLPKDDAAGVGQQDEVVEPRKERSHSLVPTFDLPTGETRVPLPIPANDDIYSELDIVQSARPLRESYDSGSGTLGSSGSYTNMDGVGDPRQSDSGDGAKTGVMRVLKNLTAKRKSSRKPKQPVNPEYSSEEFARDAYRGSFKEIHHVNNVLYQSGSECRRAKSFSSSSHKVSGQHAAASSDDKENPYSVQTHYDDGISEGIYSLATSDNPPPLPERTYLKLRQDTQSVLRTPLMGYDARGRSMTFQPPEPNNNNTNFKANYLDPSQGQRHLNQRTMPYHSKDKLPFPKGATSDSTSAKPFRWTPEHQEQIAPSSGYGSVNSDTFSQDSDYSRVPACKLPKRSRRLSSNAPPLPNRNDAQASAHYSNREAVRQAPGPSSQPTAPIGRSPSSTVSDCTLSRNKVHDLPVLPDDMGKVELVRTLHLGTVLKDKWISGIAVTKKNEYIVVDQREAYLLDDNGLVKKSIGTKGAGRLVEPMNVTVIPSNGNLVICDHAEQDIKIFSWKGQFIRKVRDPGLTNIAGIAATDDRHIVVAGTDKKRVSVLDEEGGRLYSIPGGDDKNTTPKKSPFEHPYSVTVNPLTGDIIIGDDSKQVVMAVTPRGSDGGVAKIRWRYSPGSGDRHFFPSSICADSNGYIFIADLYNEVVYMLDSGGKFIKTLLSRGNGLKGGPGAIATDCKGHLLVADEEKTLKVFKYGDDNGFAVNRRYSYCPQSS